MLQSASRGGVCSGGGVCLVSRGGVPGLRGGSAPGGCLVPGGVPGPGGGWGLLWGGYPSMH